MRRPTAKKVVVATSDVKRAARRATKASAELEDRIVPADYRRSPAVEDYIAKQRSDMHDA